MSYRLPPRPDGRMPVIHATMQSNLVMDNGTIAHLAIPFFRKFGRIVTRTDIMRWDHHGWPDPDHKDRSWQPWMKLNSYPINLVEEGYDHVEMVFLNPHDGLSATGDIEGHIVRIDVSAICPDANDKDIFVPFSAYIVGENMRDVASKGVLHVIAGPVNEGE